jgi:hypothetical protein
VAFSAPSVPATLPVTDTCRSASAGRVSNAVLTAKHQNLCLFLASFLLVIAVCSSSLLRGVTANSATLSMGQPQCLQKPPAVIFCQNSSTP